MGAEDRLLVYFAGHGQTLPLRTGEEGYILPVDADPQLLPVTAIPMEDMKRIGQRLKAKHYLFVMDACFSELEILRMHNHFHLRAFWEGLRRLDVATAGANVR